MEIFKEISEKFLRSGGEILKKLRRKLRENVGNVTEISGKFLRSDEKRNKFKKLEIFRKFRENFWEVVEKFWKNCKKNWEKLLEILRKFRENLWKVVDFEKIERNIGGTIQKKLWSNFTDF